MHSNDTSSLSAADTFAPLLPAQAQATVSFSKIYAFGDSLSDSGNDYIATFHLLPVSAIYADGRFTNGPVWVQDLASDLKVPSVTPSLAGGTDFAYGGAETGNEALHTAVPLDLPSQLAQFLIQDPHPSATALYTLSIGANDVIDAIGKYATNPALALKDISSAVGNELKFVGSLAADGARDFAILNVPDLGKTPEEAGKAAAATTLSNDYDSALAGGLAVLALADHLDITVVNSFALIDRAVADPAAYGLNNVTTPVWTGNFESAGSGTLHATGAAQNSYLFFDSLHPTETGHLALASLAVSGLKA